MSMSRRLIAVLSVWVVSAVVLMSAPRVVKVQGQPWPDGYDSGDALSADAAGRYLQLPEVNLAGAKQSRRTRNR